VVNKLKAKGKGKSFPDKTLFW